MKILKIITLILLSGAALFITGCQSVNSRFFSDNTNYSAAKELPPLKFPPGSLAVSNRYDIPAIPNKTEEVITEIKPPDY